MELAEQSDSPESAYYEFIVSQKNNNEMKSSTVKT